MFVGIQFSENDGGGIALVHSKWMTPRKSEVWWPPFKQQDYFNKSIKKGESPNETWKLYGVVKSFFEEGDYNKALQKLKKAEVTSDFPSGDEEPLPMKRKIIPSKRLFSSSDEEDENEPKHPLPPRVKAISPLLKRRKYTEVCSGSSHQSQNHRETADLSQSSSFSVLQEQEQDFNTSNPIASQKSRFSQFQNQGNENSINVVVSDLIQSTTKPLQQICRRISELEYASLNSQNEKSRVKFSVEHCDGPCLSNEFKKQYKKISLIDNYILSTYSYSKADAFCFTEDCVIQIENILTNNNQQEIKLIGRHFTSLSSFYDYPFDSRHLDIFLVSCLSEEMRMWSLSDIKGKCMILPYKDNLVSVPLFHTCQI